MAKNSFPGHDSSGYKDPGAIKILSVADVTARTAWVTANGTPPSGFMCLLVGTNVLSVWNGTAWRSIATT
jgi:hypothetical protein